MASRNAVGARNNGSYVVKVHSNGLWLACEVGAILYIPVVAAFFIGVWRVAIAALLQVESVSSAPVPCVVQVDDRVHTAFIKLGNDKVQSLEYCVIEHSGCSLQVGLGRVGKRAAGIGACQYPQVGDTDAFQLVEFLAKTFPVTPFALGTKNRGIPHVCTDVVIGLPILYEACCVGGYEVVLHGIIACSVATNSNHCYSHYECQCKIFHMCIVLFREDKK